jgi:hypothetical protein
VLDGMKSDLVIEYAGDEDPAIPTRRDRNDAMVATINAPSDHRDKAISLFTYLKELSELRTKAIRSWDQYDKVIWLADVPQEPEFHCGAWFRNPETDNEIWIEARKPRPRSAAPDPPEE